MDRRKFIKGSLSFSALLALHSQAQNINLLTNKMTHKPDKSHRFSELTLYTADIASQLEFYKSLGLTVISGSRDAFTLNVGKSKLTFKKAKPGTLPTYHYAINIPSNKIEKAKIWLSERTQLLKDSKTGNDILYFKKWDAHAIYFKDPAGNIGELIARHTLKNEASGNFGLSDLLYLSEIGLTTDDGNTMIEQLNKSYRLERYLGNSAFVGDEYGLIILPTVGYPWLPDRKLKAEIHPVEIKINDEEIDAFKVELPYKIQSVS